MEKRLYKSKDNKMIDGVCAGIGAYFKIDPTLIRIVAVILACMNGCGVLAYLIAALIMPNEPKYIE